MKHEHFHYHYPTKDSHFSGNHPTLDQVNALSERTSVITGHGQFEIYSKPNIVLQESEDKYKNQYRPYRKRAEDDSYFPVEDTKDSDQFGRDTKSLMDDKDNKSME